jgi:hypothetical protein
VANDVNLEIRYPLAEFFSTAEFEKNYPQCKLGYINGLPQISLKKFFGMSNIDAYIDKLVNIIGDYVTSLQNFLKEGGKLRNFGESKAEVTLLKDLEHLYGEFRSSDQWLLHGQRPIQRTNGSWLELDLQMKIKYADVVPNIAIEIQGPHHYINEKLNPNVWENIDAKHKEKLEWCKANGYIFLWVDWEYFHRNFVMDGQRHRHEHDRRERVKKWMDGVLIKIKTDRVQNVILIDGFPNVGLTKNGIPNVEWWDSRPNYIN